MTPDQAAAALGPRFHFGAATSAYQIEGAVAEGGRLPSMWDTFAHTSGTIKDASTGDVACDHYHRWPQDLALMSELGFNAYRFSVAWPRVVPKGRGAVNATGLDFYDRLVDALLKRGIAPYVTLYHWDLPDALAQRGGWLNRDTAAAFADYADAVARRLGDRVHSWATLNEPRCSAFVGHEEGRHAPGLRSRKSALQAAHHLLLAHGLGMAALRAACPWARAGIVLDVKPYEAVSDCAADQAAARRGDGVFNRWFLEPIFRGQYPADMLGWFGADAPITLAEDLATIAAPIDALGLNYYTRARVRHADGCGPVHLQEVPVPGVHRSQMGWEDYPQGLYTMLTRIHREYGPQDLYVAENGCAEADEWSADGCVHDPHRVRYLIGHLQAAARARQDGVPLSAYLAWSLLDNFEWGHGYRQRFGLVYVDFATQQRVPKDSALVYRDFISRAR